MRLSTSYKSPPYFNLKSHFSNNILICFSHYTVNQNQTLKKTFPISYTVPPSTINVLHYNYNGGASCFNFGFTVTKSDFTVTSGATLPFSYIAVGY